MLLLDQQGTVLYHFTPGVFINMYTQHLIKGGTILLESNYQTSQASRAQRKKTPAASSQSWW